MAQDPRHRSSCRADSVAFSHLAEHLIELWIVIQVSHNHALKKAVLKWRPCLEGDSTKSGIVEEIAGTVDALGQHGVHRHPSIHQGRVSHAELHLIQGQLLMNTTLQQLQLHGIGIGKAECTYLARFLQPVKGFCHFLWLHQRIRPMQQQYIQVIRLQPL